MKGSQSFVEAEALRTLSRGSSCLHEQHYRIEIPANQLPGWDGRGEGALRACAASATLQQKKENTIQSANNDCNATVLDGVNVFVCTKLSLS